MNVHFGLWGAFRKVGGHFKGNRDVTAPAGPKLRGHYATGH